MTDRLTFKQFAELVGVSPARISQAVRDGQLTVEVDDNGMRYIDGTRGLREWRANVDVAKAIGPAVREARKRAAEAADEADRGGEFEVPKYNDSRARLEHFKALTAEVAYREKIAELVEAARVRREAFESARALREAILSVPDRLASELAAESDPNRVHARIRYELFVALNAVADRPPPEPERAAEDAEAEEDEDIEEPA